MKGRGFYGIRSVKEAEMGAVGGEGGFGSLCSCAALPAPASCGTALRCARSPCPGNAPADLGCVTAVNPKPCRGGYICFGFVRKAEGREVRAVVKGQTTCHISLPSLATTEGCVKRKKAVVNSSAASFFKIQF